MINYTNYYNEQEVLKGIIRNRYLSSNEEVSFPNGRYEEIIAGLNSVICWNWMEIDIFWVQNGYREKVWI